MNDIHLKASKLKLEIESQINSLYGSKNYEVQTDCEDFIITFHKKKD